MRREKRVTIQTGNSENRDEGKVFIVTEMHARPAEAWGDRAFVALAHSAVKLPPGVVTRGMAGIAQLASLLGGVQYPELYSLMDELLHICVQIVPDPIKQPHVSRNLVDSGIQGDDIEEVSTRQFLRQEAIDLHTNFFLAGRTLNLISRVSEMREIPGDTQDIPTSRRRSRRSSRQDLPPSTN